MIPQRDSGYSPNFGIIYYLCATIGWFCKITFTLILVIFCIFCKCFAALLKGGRE